MCQGEGTACLLLLAAGRRAAWRGWQCCDREGWQPILSLPAAVQLSRLPCPPCLIHSACRRVQGGPVCVRPRQAGRRRQVSSLQNAARVCRMAGLLAGLSNLSTWPALDQSPCLVWFSLFSLCPSLHAGARISMVSWQPRAVCHAGAAIRLRQMCAGAALYSVRPVIGVCCIASLQGGRSGEHGWQGVQERASTCSAQRAFLARPATHTRVLLPRAGARPAPCSRPRSPLMLPSRLLQLVRVAAACQQLL